MEQGPRHMGSAEHTGSVDVYMFVHVGVGGEGGGVQAVARADTKESLSSLQQCSDHCPGPVWVLSGHSCHSVEGWCWREVDFMMEAPAFAEGRERSHSAERRLLILCSAVAWFPAWVALGKLSLRVIDAPAWCRPAARA